MSTPHILFIVSSATVIGPNNRQTGYYFPEVAHPWAVLEGAGVAVDFVTVSGGNPNPDGYDESDKTQADFSVSKAFERLAQSRPLGEVEVTAWDAIFVPGGLGPMVDMYQNPTVSKAIARAWDNELVVGAVCHGPVALLNVRLADGTLLAEGRELTGFSSGEEEDYAKDDVPFMLETALRQQGARYSKGDDWSSHVAVDGRLVTGQNPSSAEAVGESILELLGVRP